MPALGILVPKSQFFTTMLCSMKVKVNGKVDDTFTPTELRGNTFTPTKLRDKVTSTLKKS